MYHLKKYSSGAEKGGMVYIAPHVGYNPKKKKVEYNNWDEIVNKPLTFDIVKGGTLIWARTDDTDGDFNRSISYSKNGDDFVTISASKTNSTTINVSAGDVLIFRHQNTSGYSQGHDSSPCSCGFKDGTATFNVSGNIASIIDPNNYSISPFTTYIQRFFRNAGVIDASELVIGTTYPREVDYFFTDCTLLTGAPQLPYNISTMDGYTGMFTGCTSLKIPPALPGTTLASSSNHYAYMFKGCTSLEKAPLLPAPTLRNYNYQSMFEDCSNLNYVEAYMFTGGASYLENWLKNVSSSGTLVVNNQCDSYCGMSIDSTCPSGWTRVNSFYKTTSVPLYHRYINTGITINQNDKIYCRFVGKEENVIIGSETEENVNKFKIYINSSHQLCVNFTDSQGTEYNHTVPISLTDGVNEFELDLSTLAGRLNNGSFGFGHGDDYGLPVSGAHYLYVHAMNRGSNSEIVDLSDNEFNLRELKITSSTNSIRYHIVPISFYGRRCFVKWGSGDAVMVYPTKYVQSS